MPPFKFDRDDLIAKLGTLTAPLRTAFAAACAERLLVGYATYHLETGAGDPTLLTGALSSLWNHLEGAELTAEESARLIDECMSIIPEDGKWPWSPSWGAAEDAIAAVVYALKAKDEEGCQSAAWAAQCIYDSLDGLVIRRESVDVNQADAEDRILEHPLVQRELAREQRDLTDLRRVAMMPSLPEGFMGMFRQRASAEGKSSFDEPN